MFPFKKVLFAKSRYSQLRKEKRININFWRILWKKLVGLLIAIISIVLFGCATTSNISVAPSEIEYKEISGKNYFISRDSELYSSQSNAVYVDYENQKVKGEVVEAGVTNLFGQIAKTISNIPNIKSFGIRIKTHTIYVEISENEVWQKILVLTPICPSIIL